MIVIAEMLKNNIFVLQLKKYCKILHFEKR